jgi:hypothetical protein
MLVPNILASVGHYYNDAPILIESNVASEIGHLLHTELEYPEVLWTKKDKQNKLRITYSGAKAQIGICTNYNVKAIGCSTLKSLIENDQLKIIDKNTVAEFTTFVAKGKSFEAQDGAHDDLIMCAVIFAWATRDPLFLELSQHDSRKEVIEKRSEEDEISLKLPFGFRKTGREINISSDIDENSYSDGKMFWHIVR